MVTNEDAALAQTSFSSKTTDQKLSRLLFKKYQELELTHLDSNLDVLR